jgi:hypothetical protein
MVLASASEDQDDTPRTTLAFCGPYHEVTCALDDQNISFPRMADIYSSFQGTLCPPGTHLVCLWKGSWQLLIGQSTWPGQFVVSRKRLLGSPLRNYQNLVDLFNAPEDHWMWKEGWGNNQPSNPTLGEVHLLTRRTQADRTRSCLETIMAGHI